MSDFEVTTEVAYRAQDSDPAVPQYVFTYTITIANRGAQGAQLLNRHWIITDGEGKVSEVQGEGVVGQQPHIPPDRGFRYTSGCVLETPFGTMEGNYEFQYPDGRLFLVPIPLFVLSVPNTVH